jgi:hypothetical protein
MSGFSADWLTLRESADTAARSPAVLQSLRAHFAEHNAVCVCDLGSGTGAAVAAFDAYLPARQRWQLADDDAANLAAAKRLRETDIVTVEPVLADLSASLAPWGADCQLVTATALFDLASPAWITGLVERLAADRLPLLATLTYDGVQSFSASHSADAAMLAAFNRHQRLNKGLGGPAAGPDGAAVLAGALEAQGYRLTRAASPWRLGGRQDAAMIAAVLAGWAKAVADAGFVDAGTVRDWRETHLERADSLTVGHWDLFAIPGSGFAVAQPA